MRRSKLDRASRRCGPRASGESSRPGQNGRGSKRSQAGAAVDDEALGVRALHAARQLGAAPRRRARADGAARRRSRCRPRRAADALGAASCAASPAAARRAWSARRSGSRFRVHRCVPSPVRRGRALRRASRGVAAAACRCARRAAGVRRRASMRPSKRPAASAASPNSIATLEASRRCGWSGRALASICTSTQRHPAFVEAARQAVRRTRGDARRLRHALEIDLDARVDRRRAARRRSAPTRRVRAWWRRASAPATRRTAAAWPSHRPTSRVRRASRVACRRSSGPATASCACHGSGEASADASRASSVGGEWRVGADAQRTVGKREPAFATASAARRDAPLRHRRRDARARRCLRRCTSCGSPMCRLPTCRRSMRTSSGSRRLFGTGGGALGSGDGAVRSEMRSADSSSKARLSQAASYGSARQRRPRHAKPSTATRVLWSGDDHSMRRAEKAPASSAPRASTTTSPGTFCNSPAAAGFAVERAPQRGRERARATAAARRRRRSARSGAAARRARGSPVEFTAPPRR